MSTDKNKPFHKTVFGERLKECRLKKSLSQKKLGILANIDDFSASPRINQYERGTHTPDYKIATCLAKVLDVPVCYFYIDNPDWLEIILSMYQLDESELSDLKKYITQKLNKK